MGKESVEKDQMIADRISQSFACSLPRVVLTFGASHPFDLLKTQFQANPHITSAYLFSKDILKRKGVKGFYTAASVSFPRALVTDSYRSSLRLLSSQFYKKYMPSSSALEQTAAVAGTMTVTDSVLLAPLERLKVWLMTHHPGNKQSLASFFTNRDPSALSLRQDLFKGFSLTITRTGVSWFSFLMSENIIRQQFNKLSPYNQVQNPQLSLVDNLLIGGLSGFINALFTIPFDTLKTKVQCQGSPQHITFKEIWAMAEHDISKYGIRRGLYRGFIFKLIQSMIGGAMNSDTNNRMDHIWDGPSDKPSLK